MISLVFDKLRTKQFLISSSYWGGSGKVEFWILLAPLTIDSMLMYDLFYFILLTKQKINLEAEWDSEAMLYLWLPAEISCCERLWKYWERVGRNLPFF